MSPLPYSHECALNWIGVMSWSWCMVRLGIKCNSRSGRYYLNAASAVRCLWSGVRCQMPAVWMTSVRCPRSGARGRVPLVRCPPSGVRGEAPAFWYNNHGIAINKAPKVNASQALVVYQIERNELLRALKCVIGTIIAVFDLSYRVKG